MKIKILTMAIIILLGTICNYSQNIETSYKVPFNSKNNIIDLIINNQSTQTLKQIKVETVEYPEWIQFRNNEILINEMKSFQSYSASFTFDVDKLAPAGSKERISFIITDNMGNSYLKKININISSPENFELFQNYPNPFNPTTTIAYQVPKTSVVNLSVYNLLGEIMEVLANEEKSPGYYEIIFDANKYASGIYFYRLTAASYIETKKIILLK